MQGIDWVLKQAMLSLAQVLPDFRSFSTVDYVAYGFNIPGESDRPESDGHARLT